MIPRLVRSVAVVAAATLAFSACSDGSSGDDAAVTTGSAEQTTVATSAPGAAATTIDTATSSTSEPTTVPTPASTDVPATAPPAPAPTAAPAPPPPVRADLVLRDGGVGTSAFGDSDVAVLTYLDSILGTPVSDQLGAYPDTDDALFVDADDAAYVQPHGRSTCWDNQFCVYFGGRTPDPLTFTGWWQDGDEVTGEPLRTGSGFTVGDRVSGFVGAIDVAEGGCYSSGSGIADGMLVSLVSDGEPFSFVDDAGNFVNVVPDPSKLTITAIESGDRPFFLYDDC